jgi:hypothetical protein
MSLLETNSNRSSIIKITWIGLLAGFISSGIAGALFMSPLGQSVLYNPEWQSKTFIDITTARNLPLSIAGLIVVGIIHAWFYDIFKSSIQYKEWWKKGLFWGFCIWAMFWLPQEWWVYHTLLQEPLILNLFELMLLLIESLIEGLIIAYFIGLAPFEKWIMLHSFL